MSSTTNNKTAASVIRSRPSRHVIGRAIVGVGDRVELTRDVERFPDFIAPKGWTGTIVECDADFLSLKLDQHLPGAEDWDNCLIFTAEDYHHDGEHPSDCLKAVDGGTA